MELNLLEEKALEAMNRNQFGDAIELWNKIVSQNTFWEHGQPFYNIACCYEEIGDLDNAEKNYLRALDFSPENSYFLGGYASFLFQFRPPQMAFEYYLKLLKVDEENEDEDGKQTTMLGLYELAKRLELSREKVNEIITEYLNRIS